MLFIEAVLRDGFPWCDGDWFHEEIHLSVKCPRPFRALPAQRSQSLPLHFMRLCVPEMPQIPFAFAFDCNQPNGNSVDFWKKINIIPIRQI